jgi:hypothetical protein
MLIHGRHTSILLCLLKPFFTPLFSFMQNR